MRRYNNIILWDIGHILFKHEDKIYSYYTDKEFIKDFIKIENEDVEKNIKNFKKPFTNEIRICYNFLR